jgi:drug/metabolite transporter (DMT)-like permease
MTDSPVQRPIVGILWMVITGLLFVCVTALVKYMGPVIPAAEAAFLRYAVGLVFILPFVRRLDFGGLSGRQWRFFGLRAVTHTAGVTLWFYAMARIPIADVTALNYLSPVYVTLGAALFLGETLALRRILAVAAALVGALIILRPGLREIGPGHMAMLFAAVVFAVSYLTAKRMTDETGPQMVLVMLSFGVTIGLAPLAASVWVTPGLHELAVLSAVAALATTGHYTMTLAFREAPVTVTQPVTFLQLVWAVSLGVIVFGEPIDPWVVLGGTVILTAISFMTWREAMLKRRVVTPPVPATKV